MLISEVIDRIKNYHNGTYNGQKIMAETTRDKILFGDANQECTGIITTCWATVDVIKKAIESKANLIICHEALFWNHGDHQEWLKEHDNETYKRKVALLNEGKIVVWRDHDYIHSGIPMKDGTYKDGIFYGLAKVLGWEDYVYENDTFKYMHFVIPETTTALLAKHLVDKLHLNGVKIIGRPDSKVTKVRIPMHVLADANEQIIEAEKDDINCFLTMELIDFTLMEYVRDTSMLGIDKSIIGMGHFNLEEPGMEYMLEWLPEAIGVNIPMQYVQSGDNYSYITK